MATGALEHRPGADESSAFFCPGTKKRNYLPLLLDEQGRREGFEKASRRGLKCLLELKFGQAAFALIARLPELGVDILESLQDALESGADLRQLEQLVP